MIVTQAGGVTTGDKCSNMIPVFLIFIAKNYTNATGKALQLAVMP
jgi:hypothetical protein